MLPADRSLQSALQKRKDTPLVVQGTPTTVFRVSISHLKTAERLPNSLRSALDRGNRQFEGKTDPKVDA